MAALSIVEDSAPTKHVLCINWFERDPGGATIFITPPREDAASHQLIVEHDSVAIAYS
jgi:hypothetical protein